jgi:hypothetical protein
MLVAMLAVGLVNRQSLPAAVKLCGILLFVPCRRDFQPRLAPRLSSLPYKSPLHLQEEYTHEGKQVIP